MSAITPMKGMTQPEGGSMDLTTLAIGGLVAAVVLIVISITLINKFAS